MIDSGPPGPTYSVSGGRAISSNFQRRTKMPNVLQWLAQRPQRGADQGAFRTDMRNWMGDRPFGGGGYMPPNGGGYGNMDHPGGFPGGVPSYAYQGNFKGATGGAGGQSPSGNRSTTKAGDVGYGSQFGSAGPLGPTSSGYGGGNAGLNSQPRTPYYASLSVPTEMLPRPNAFDESIDTWNDLIQQQLNHQRYSPMGPVHPGRPSPTRGPGRRSGVPSYAYATNFSGGGTASNPSPTSSPSSGTTTASNVGYGSGFGAPGPGGSFGYASGPTTGGTGTTSTATTTSTVKVYDTYTKQYVTIPTTQLATSPTRYKTSATATTYVTPTTYSSHGTGYPTSMTTTSTYGAPAGSQYSSYPGSYSTAPAGTYGTTGGVYGHI